jgi:AcrR family transcriptional regulator
MTNKADSIYAAARDLAVIKGFHGFTVIDVASRAGISVGLVSHYCGKMDSLRATLVMRAKEKWDGELLAQALLAKHPKTKIMSEGALASTRDHLLQLIATIRVS